MFADNIPPALPMAEALQHPERSGDYIQGQADFLSGINYLMNSLRTSREADRTQHNFEFLLGASSMVEIPSSISMYCGTTIEDAQITFSKDAGEEPLVSLELHFRRDKDNKLLSLHASRDPLLFDSTDDDAVLIEGSDEIFPVDRIPKADINALVLGLALGQTIHDREALENANFFSSTTQDTLIDALQKRADSWQTHIEYGFNDDQRKLQWSTQSTGAGESLETCQFSYETSNYDRSIVVDIDPRKGLALSFSQRDSGDTNTPMSPDTGDIIRLQEIISELIQQYDTTEVVPTDPSKFSDEGIIKRRQHLPGFEVRYPEDDSED